MAHVAPWHPWFQETTMIRVGFPAIIYLDGNVYDFDAAVRYAQNAMVEHDHALGHLGLWVGGTPIVVWLQRHRPLLVRVPSSRPRGVTLYEVQLQVYIDMRKAARRTWPEESVENGEYTYVVPAGDALEAVEAARDMLAATRSMAGLDRADLQVVAVTPHSERAAALPPLNTLSRVGLPCVMTVVGHRGCDASNQHAHALPIVPDHDSDCFATVAGGIPGVVRLDRKRSRAPGAPSIPPLGRKPYKVEMRLLVDGQVSTPRDWPADDPDAGPYYYLLWARDALDAVEAAKDEFAQTHQVSEIDRSDLEVVAVTRYSGMPLE
jgi:hypothetical protein